MSTKKTKFPSMAAQQIIELLAIKHHEDVFVPECKDGPTQGANHLRLDAWAMARSWSNPTTWGYEVKVSRSDFLKDDKWQGYLAYCSDFYFVCPMGLIQPEELPPEAGLLWANPGATRLYTKKKASRRLVEIPENIFRYILMCRVKNLSKEYACNSGESREWAIRSAAELKADKELGCTLERLIAAKVQREVLKVQEENRLLKQENERLSETRQALAAAGMSPWQASEFVRRAAKAASDKIPNHILWKLQRLAGVGDDVRELLKVLDGEGEQ
jgi:hypothetical protein